MHSQGKLIILPKMLLLSKQNPTSEVILFLVGSLKQTFAAITSYPLKVRTE